MVAQAHEALGGLDTLVLNAAQQISCAAIEELPMEQVIDTFHVNIIAMFGIVKAAVPHLPAGSSIVTTTSVKPLIPVSICWIMQQRRHQLPTLPLV